MSEQLLFALSVTAPAFFMMAGGAALRRLGLIDEVFIDKASRLVFTIGLPVVLFFNSAGIDLSTTLNSSWLGFACLLTLGVTALAWLYSALVSELPAQRAVITQGGYRGNLGVVGLALCDNAYGAQGLALAALPVGVLTLLYNVIAVYLLASTHHKQLLSRQQLLLSIAKNPLIIGISAGLLVAYSGVILPAPIWQSGHYIGQLALPLALLCIGGSMTMRGASALAGHACFLKLVVAPLFIVLALVAAGLQGTLLGVFFLLAASPTAASSFVMVQAARGDGVLAGQIVALSTLGSVVTITIGLLLLRHWQLIG